MKNNVYECINISNVINKLGLRKIHQIGSNIYVNCPFCQNGNEKNGYMKINTVSNLYICDNCERSGTSIELYAHYNFITTKEAFKQLLKETPVLDDMPYIYNNSIRDEYYRDFVYNKFLELQQLNEKHKEKLINMRFTETYIEENKFKSIENNPKKKKQICMKLKEDGIRLDGIPGFFQDTDFKWTYQSHKGIFIPAILNNKIQGLRICLDEKYKEDTENIWFSSNNLYNGTKANNWPIVLKENADNWLDLYNTNKNDSIIIATEIILAHKLFNDTHKVVVGIPNNIDKDIILSIVSRLKAKEIFLYVDYYTIRHTDIFIQKNVIEVLESKGIKIHFRIAINYEKENSRIEEKQDIAA